MMGKVTSTFNVLFVIDCAELIEVSEAKQFQVYAPPELKVIESLVVFEVPESEVVEVETKSFEESQIYNVELLNPEVSVILHSKIFVREPLYELFEGEDKVTVGGNPRLLFCSI